MIDKLPNYNHQANRANIVRYVGAFVTSAVLLSGCASSTSESALHASESTVILMPSPSAIEPSVQQLNSLPPVSTSELPTITPEAIKTATLQSIDLFNSGDQTLIPYKIKFTEGKAPDFTPPIKDGVFITEFFTKTNSRDYDFGNTLQVLPDGSVQGDLFIAGHTNKSKDWVMNGIKNAKIGDTWQLTADGVTYDVTVTSRELFQKHGSDHEVTNISDAFGPNGLVVGCYVTLDANGKEVQSGKLVGLGIKITKPQNQ